MENEIKIRRPIHPEYYLAGDKGVFHGTTIEGTNCYDVSNRAKPLIWKKLKSVYKWVKLAREIDPTIEIIDNSW